MYHSTPPLSRHVAPAESTQDYFGKVGSLAGMTQDHHTLLADVSCLSSITLASEDEAASEYLD